jgi:hypothetical protein
VSTTALLQEQQPDVQRGVTDTRKATAAQGDRGDALPVSTNPQAVELMSTTEPKSSFATKSDMAAQPRPSNNPNNVASHPRNSQHDVVRNAAPVQENSKLNETNDFEKLCLAYRASLNQRQNFVFDSETVPLVEPLASTTLVGLLLKHDLPASPSATDSVESPNRVSTELGSGTSQVLGLARNGHDENHHMSNSKQKDLCVSDASSMDVDVPSPDHQDASAPELESSTVMPAAEPLTTSRPHQLDSPRLAPGQAQPRPAPGSSPFITCIIFHHILHSDLVTTGSYYYCLIG